MTIREVATLAGVSSAAVSRYLNGGSLSQEKREAIRIAIAQTGYIPDTTAQALRTKTTNYVGVIVPKLSANAVGKMTEGISSVLSEQGYFCLLANTSHNPEQELSYLELFQCRAVAGIILMATTLTPHHQDQIRACPIPIVVVGQQMDGVPCVYHDDFHAAKAVTEQLIARGRKKIGYIGVTTQDIAVGVQRKKGVQAALQEAGMNANIPYEVTSFSVAGGAKAMETLLQQQPELDAVMCATDHIALGAMETLKQHHISIPEQVSIAGLDDSWVGVHVTPKLTTAHFYYEECGMEAAQMLLTMIQQKNKDLVRQTMLGYTVISRESI